ncbi:MAG: lysophospholipase [Oligoflexia bacterium]|nr:lysophospholipase [Oligoflexia bacterium]
MGTKVIVVEQSTGGLIGFILGLENKVDGAILLQPAFSLTARSSLASIFGSLLQSLSLTESRLNPLGGRMVSRLISRKLPCLAPQSGEVCNLRKNYIVPTRFYAASNDDVVGTPAIERVVDEIGPPIVQLEVHDRGHMFIPALGEIRGFADEI